MVPARRSTAAVPLLLLLLLAVSVSSTSPSPDRGQEQDRSALLRLKDAVPSAGLFDRWSPGAVGADHCYWPWVSCDARSRVVAILAPSGFPRGSGSGVAGRLPPSVGLLTELKELALPSLGLFGEIPAEIWRLEKLQHVNLAGNSLRAPSRPPSRRG
ncbi:hypothetical protein ZWY2020_025809 [Hordeum vulgare]|nr:hypothetical protein ZWY2020_025809 [Hordeum vulgare]